MKQIPRTVAGGLLLVLLAVTGASRADAGGDTEEPEPTTTAAGGGSTDEALAEELQAEIEALLAEMGASGDPSSLLGEAGDLDLPPGELVYTGVVEAVSAEDLPDGGGSELSGPCLGLALSFDGDGAVLDAAADFDPAAPPIDLVDGGQAFTSSNPFEVDVNGWVVYAGKAEPAPIDHSWKIVVQGLSLDKGGDDNPDAETHNAGSVDLAGDLPAPAKVSALFHIDGSMSAADGFNCQGSGYIKTVGGAPVLAGVGLILLLAGGIGALFNARPAKTW